MSVELTHKGALNRMKDIGDEIERLSGKDELTDEEERDFFTLTAEFDELDAHRKNLERSAEKARVTSVIERENLRTGIRAGNMKLTTEDGVQRTGDYDRDPILNPDSIEDRRFKNPWDLSEVRTFSRDRGDIANELRSRALSAIEKMPGADDLVRKGATSIIENWDDANSSLARMCLATSSPAYMRGWSKIARGKGHMVTTDEQDALSRAMTLTDSSGGYLVPFQLDPTVIITSTGTRNEIRKVARQVIAIGDIWNGVSSGQVNWSFAAEATEASDNSTTFVQPSINVYKAQGFVPISIEALEDEQNVTQEVARLLAFGREDLEAQKFITGTGAGEPFGIVATLTGTASELTSGTNTLALAQVYNLDNNLPARYRGNASWLGHRAIYNVIRNIDTAGGAGMWVQLPNDLGPQMLGRQVYEAEAMSSTITTGSRNLIYGDFQNYVIADRLGMTVEFIPHLVGTNRRPTGQRGWYAYYRVGADSVNKGGFRMNKVG